MAKYIRELKTNYRDVSVYVSENSETIFACTGFRGDDGATLTPKQAEKLGRYLIHAAKVAKKNALLASAKEALHKIH